MKHSSFGLKVVFWVIFLLGCGFVLDGGMVEKFVGLAFTLGASIIAFSLGNGNLEISSELDADRVFKVIQSVPLPNGNGHAVCVANTYGQEGWFRFKELPPQRFLVVKKKGKKQFVPVETI